MSTQPDIGDMTGLQRVFWQLLARPVALLIALVIVTAFALWQASKTQVAVDLSGLIGQQTAGAQAITNYERRFGGFNVEELLLVRSESFGDPANLAAFEDLIFELQFAPGVGRVISIAGLPAPGRQGAWLSGPELSALPADARLQRMRGENPLAAQLISADLSAAAVVVVSDGTLRGEAFSASVAQAAALVPSLDIAPVGLIAVQRAIAQELVADLLRLTPSAVILCVIIAMIMFRGWRPVAVVTLPPVVGLIWFFGWMGTSGTGIDPVMGALPIVLLVLAFSDSIHVYHAAIHARQTSGISQRAALAQALAETTPAAFLTSLTTMIAFGSMAFADSPSLNTMALAGSVGMAVSLLAVLVLTPVLMWSLNAPNAKAQTPSLFTAVVAPARRASKAIRPVVVISALVLIVFAALQSQSRTGFRYADYLPRGAPVSAALADMDALGLGSDRMLVVVEADPDAPLTRVRAAIAAIWGEDQTAWAQGAAGADMLTRMGSRDGTAHALPVQLPILAQDVPADTVLNALEARIAAAGLAPHVQIVGPGQALLTEGPRLVSSLRMGLFATIAVITLMVMVVYRSVRLGLVSLLANLIPILGVEAWLVLMGRELAIMNVIALTVAFGIAVDDTLHLLNRFRLARGDTGARVEQALAEAAPPMVGTTLILLAGLLVTLASALPGLAIFGGLIALAVGLALIADLFLLPGLMRWSLR